jgi:hypothetical protein
VSQPRPDASWPQGRPKLSRSGSSPGTANPWSPERIDVAVAGRPRNVADPHSDPTQSEEEWPPDPAEGGAAPENGPAEERGTGDDRTTDADQTTDAAQRPAGERGALTLTGRGAVAGMLVLFFFTLLVASWLEWGWLAGASFVIGSGAAARYTRRRDLLVIAVSPPLLFLCALICVKALTANGSTIISTVEGTALTLANVAPWLFAGVILYLIIAWVRGLPQCVTDLRRDLRPDLQAPRSGNSGATGGQATDSRAAYRPGPRHYR